mgnify:CR=1 FL=1
MENWSHWKVILFISCLSKDVEKLIPEIKKVYNVHKRHEGSGGQWGQRGLLKLNYYRTQIAKEETLKEFESFHMLYAFTEELILNRFAL